ncbi:hypothetical protein GCM10010472_23350 [Pseudonocardia halophobica]|uniref:Uncharacterized protein n=1 Tax=Pseudonocardia halophobica TaxID=29401 RepID=A0A9W6NUG4_9PSEU|nr:hypothetical protein GCM10017577_07080 [Pseudonocardia halophobica]
MVWERRGRLAHRGMGVSNAGGGFPSAAAAAESAKAAPVRAETNETALTQARLVSSVTRTSGSRADRNRATGVLCDGLEARGDTARARNAGTRG